MSSEPLTQKQARKPAAFINKFAAFLIQAPFIGSRIGKQLMLISFTGRKSGKTFTTPIGYQRQSEDILVFFTDHPWWKNLLSNPEVSVVVERKKRIGRAEVVHDDTDAVVEGLAKHIEHSQRVAQAFHIDIDQYGKPKEESLREQARRIAMVRVHLNK